MAEQPKVSILLQLVDKLTEPINGIRGQVTRFGDVLKGLAATIAATFTAAAMYRFFRDSVQEGIKAEQSFQRLDTALRNLGQSYASVSPEVEKVLDRIQKTTRYSDDDAREALTHLVTATGDLDKALGLLPTALDLAAYKQIGLVAASDALIKVSAGNNRGLKEFGIELEKGGDGVAALRAKMGPFAENEAKTFGWRLAIINNLWGEFKEKIGLAIIGSEQLGGGVDGLAGLLVKMAEWVERNTEKIGDFVGGLMSVVTWLGKLTGSGAGQASGFFSFMRMGWEQLKLTVGEFVQKFKLAIGGVLQLTGELVQKIAGPLKVFGIKLGDGMAEAGAKMQAQAAADLAGLHDGFRKTYAQIYGTVKEKGEQIGDASDTVVTRVGTSHAQIAETTKNTVKKAKDAMVAALGEVVAKVKDTTEHMPPLRDATASLAAAAQKLGDGWVYVNGSWQPQKMAEVEETLADVAYRVADTTDQIRDLAHAAGLATPELDAMLAGVADIAEGIGRLASGDILGGITAGVAGIRSIADMFFGESASARFVRLALEKHREALEKHRDTLGDLIAISSPGAKVASIQAAGARITGTGGLLGALDNPNSTVRNAGMGALVSILAAQGLSIGDLDEIAKQMGLDIRDDKGRISGKLLGSFFGVLGELDTGIPKGFTGQFGFLKDKWSLSGAGSGEKFQDIIGLLSGANGSPFLRDLLAGFDLSTAEGRNALLAKLPDILANRGQVGAAGLGGLNLSQFNDVLGLIADLIRDMGEEAGVSAPTGGVTSTADEAIEEAITETPELLTGIEGYLASLDMNVAKLVPGLTIPEGLLASALETFTGPGANQVPIEVNVQETVNVSVSGDADPRAIAQGVQDGLRQARRDLLREINEQLAREYRLDRLSGGFGS